VSQKNCHSFVFQNNSVKRGTISIIIGIWSLEETLHQKVVNLSTSPEIVTALPCETQNYYSLTVCNNIVKKLLIQAVKV